MWHTTYSVISAIIEKKKDGPGPRCGHTLTAVPTVGEEGSPNYIGPRLILFGGATVLEGNSAASGTPSSAGNAGIRELWTGPNRFLPGYCSSDWSFGLGFDKVSVPSILVREGHTANLFSMCFGHDGTGKIYFGDKGSIDPEETSFNINSFQWQ